MGKAIIQSHLGDGLYSVKIQFDNAKVEARKSQITTQITEIDTKLTDIAARKADAYAKFQADLSALNIAIDEFNENPSEIAALTKTAYESRAAYDLIVSEERREKTKKTALEKEKQYLIDNCPAELTTNAWCVSKNTTLYGATETIEVDYLLNRNGSQIEHDTGVWIPATQTQSSPTPPTSILQHPMATSQHACWYNAAVLPGAQRDQMRYRVGTISELNKDWNTCTVIFDGQSSINKFDGKTVPNLPIFPELIDTVSATIEYPPCNGQAFEIGDRVIVKNGNVVIGFYSNPRKCAPTLGVSYGYVPIERIVTGSQTPVVVDGELYIDVTYGHYHTITKSECDIMGLEYPHKVEEFPSKYLGRFARTVEFFSFGAGNFVETSSLSNPGLMIYDVSILAGYHVVIYQEHVQSNLFGGWSGAGGSTDPIGYHYNDLSHSWQLQVKVTPPQV